MFGLLLHLGQSWPVQYPFLDLRLAVDTLKAKLHIGAFKFNQLGFIVLLFCLPYIGLV